jgi:hypothetical protein
MLLRHTELLNVKKPLLWTAISCIVLCIVILYIRHIYNNNPIIEDINMFQVHETQSIIDKYHLIINSVEENGALDSAALATDTESYVKYDNSSEVTECLLIVQHDSESIIMTCNTDWYCKCNKVYKKYLLLLFRLLQAIYHGSNVIDKDLNTTTSVHSLRIKEFSVSWNYTYAHTMPNDPVIDQITISRNAR